MRSHAACVVLAACIALAAAQDGRPDSCACEHNSYCCGSWSGACSDCESGVGNAFGCDAGVCGASSRSDFPFAKAELGAGGEPAAGPYRDMTDGGMHGGLYDGLLGTVTFERVGSAVQVAYNIRGLVPGSRHGFYIHESADFSDGCLSAGGYFNPFGAGGPSASSRNVGDLGNIEADDQGVATGVFTDTQLTLAGDNTVVGRSVVLHEGVDDLGLGGAADSLTTGRAGGRLACGEIVGSDYGCSATASSQPIVGRQCQDVNVLGAWGTTSGMVLGREWESRAVCAYVPCRPAGYSYPLIVLLHGYGSNGTRQEMYERFTPMADEMGFILAIPHGTHEGGSGQRFWSATEACCNFGPTGSPDLGGSEPLADDRDRRSLVDDSGYIRKLIEVIQDMYTIDPRRIHVTGHSNGGYMSHRMACDHSDLLAGVASLAGSTFEGVISGEYDVPGLPDYSCSPTYPIHVLEVHGTGDTVVPYAGGKPGGQKTLPAPTTFEVWAGLNDCDDNSVQVESFALDMVTPPSPDTDIHAAGGCAAGGASELWTVRGAAHSPQWLAASNGGTTMSRHAVQWLLAHPKPTAGWGPTLAALHNADTPTDAWREAVMPAAMTTKFSYTQTWCSYRGDQSETLPGWRKIAVVDPEDGPCENPGPCEVIDPATGVRRGGMHALAFISDDGGRLIFAFRGTDLDPSAVSGRADSCSNTMRGGTAFEDLPQPRCAGFTFYQLDYISRAREFVQGVLMQVGPVPDVITTGHSLGSHLATMMAVEFGFWSVSFGSGGGERSVVGCDGLHGSCAVPQADLCTPTDEPPVEQRLMVLNNPYDPGHYRATERGMMGWVCAWDGQFEEPASCHACYGEGDEGQCGRCFAETHIYAFYLDLVNTAARPPTCAQHPATELCAMLGANSTTAELGTFDAATAAVRDRLAQADAAAGPGGLVLGGIVIGLALACCVRLCCARKKPKEAGYKPVTFNHE